MPETSSRWKRVQNAALATLMSLVPVALITVSTRVASITRLVNSPWLALAFIAGAFSLAGVSAFFLFALYRTSEPVFLRPALRRLALVAAMALGGLVVVAAAECLATRLWSDIRSLAGVAFPALAQVCYMLLLLALRRPISSETPSVAESEALRYSARMAVVIWSVVLAFEILKFAITPIGVLLAARQAGVVITSTSLALVMIDAVRELIGVGAVMVAPYVVYKSLSLRTKPASAVSCQAV